VIWIHERIIHILRTIEKLLPYVNVGSFLNGIAQTCDYCGQSLGNVGIDFRGLLPTIFEKRIVALFTENCESAIIQFESALTSHDWYMTVDVLSKLGKQHNAKKRENNNERKDNVDNNEHKDNADNNERKDNADNNITMQYTTTGDACAPSIILQYPPLAVFTNGIIKAFNELREFVTYNVMLDCKKILMNTLQSNVDCIKKYRMTTENKLNIANNQNKQNKQINNDNVKNFNNNIENNNNVNDNNKKQNNNQIDEILSNMIKIECEYLVPFICDIFDLIFERTHEIKIEQLLEYFQGFYEMPSKLIV